MKIVRILIGLAVAYLMIAAAVTLVRGLRGAKPTAASPTVPARLEPRPARANTPTEDLDASILSLIEGGQGQGTDHVRRLAENRLSLLKPETLAKLALAEPSLAETIIHQLSTSADLEFVAAFLAHFPLETEPDQDLALASPTTRLFLQSFALESPLAAPEALDATLARLDWREPYQLAELAAGLSHRIADADPDSRRDLLDSYYHNGKHPELLNPLSAALVQNLPAAEAANWIFNAPPEMVRYGETRLFLHLAPEDYPIGTGLIQEFANQNQGERAEAAVGNLVVNMANADPGGALTALDWVMGLDPALRTREILGNTFRLALDSNREAALQYAEAIQDPEIQGIFQESLEAR